MGSDDTFAELVLRVQAIVLELLVAYCVVNVSIGVATGVVNDSVGVVPNGMLVVANRLVPDRRGKAIAVHFVGESTAEDLVLVDLVDLCAVE